MSSSQPGALGGPGAGLELEFPQSIAIYDKYVDAQKAVDFLADNKFPVQNLAIVGTDLKLIERVTGRKNWGSVIGAGVINGVMTGLVLGILFSLFAAPGQLLAVFAMAIGLAIVLNVLMGVFSYALSGGRRDFNSVTQTVPTRFEVLCEHKVAAEAREKLKELPGARASAFE